MSTDDHDLTPDPEHEDHHTLRRPESSDTYSAITRTGDGLGETLCSVVDVTLDGVTAPVPAYMTLPVPLEDFRLRSDDPA